MITINNKGRFSIPDEDVFIGFAGDNLSVKREFFLEGVTDPTTIYRMYLLFDDGTSNFFLLDKELMEKGTKLIWNIESDHIFKSGIVILQIKGTNSQGKTFHTCQTSLVVQKSIEFSESYNTMVNSEFLQQEEKLNGFIEKANTIKAEADELYAKIKEAQIDSVPTENSESPITSGGVHYALSTKLDDADNSVKENNIADNAVTSDKIMNSSIGFEKFSADTMIDKSSDSGMAYTFASDTHIPTTAFVKAVNEETKEIIENGLADLEIVKIGYGEDLANYKDRNKLYYAESGISAVNGISLDGGAGNYVGFIRYVGENWIVLSYAGMHRGVFVINSAGNVTPVADTEPKKNSNNLITSGAVYNNSEYLKRLISEIPKFNIAVVNELPTENISDTTIYLLASGNDESNIFTEYVYVDKSWEKLGTQTVDLSNYVQKTDYATDKKAGLVKPGMGLTIQEGGKLAGDVLSAGDVHNGDPQNIISAGSLREYFKYRSTTSISETATDTQFPTAKAVYNELNQKLDNSIIETGSFKLTLIQDSLQFADYISSQSCSYFKIGNMVTLNISVVFNKCVKSEHPELTSYILSWLTFSGLPYPCNSLKNMKGIVFSNTGQARGYVVNNNMISLFAHIGIKQTSADTSQDEGISLSISYII